MSQTVVAFHVNGREVSVQGDSGQSLLDVLRNTLHLKATRMGCGQGACGACRVMVDGHAMAACGVDLSFGAQCWKPDLCVLGADRLPNCMTLLEIGVVISFTINYNANYNAAAPLSNLKKCASCGKWRCEINTSAMNLKFLGKFNHNTIQLP